MSGLSDGAWQAVKRDHAALIRAAGAECWSLGRLSLVGAEPLPRTAVVAKVWSHIRKHEFQDPANWQAIVADDRLRAVFGKDRATMFEMQKLLSAHLTAA